MMREMTERLGRRPRAGRGRTPRRTRTTCAAGPSSATCPRSQGISAGGMPTRVKCLHVLVAHSLAAGPGVNPLGDEALAMLAEWWAAGPACPSRTAADATDAGRGEADGMTRVAAIDCGTNSIRLLVADVDPATAG